MSKFTYNPTRATRNLLDQVNAILDMYGDSRPTLRNIFYRLVAINYIANNRDEYKKLSEKTTKARYADIIHWWRIDDRLRKPSLPYQVENIDEAMDDTIEGYRLDRMAGQDRYIEIWSEKDSISGVLSPIAAEYGINLMVNRGYGSVTALFEGAGRFHGKPNPLILYFGDHDPSGLDMIRDVESRLRRMGSPVEMQQVALTRQQVEDLQLPPNYAKLTDSRSGYIKKTGQVRSGSYIDIYGWESWELDAIPIDILEQLLRDTILKNIDTDKYQSVQGQEEADKSELRILFNKR